MPSRLVLVGLFVSLLSLSPAVVRGRAPAPRVKPDEADRLFRQGVDAFEGPKGPIDERHARALFVRAAARGHPVASAVVGWMTIHGIGGRKDEEGGAAMIAAAMPAVRKKAEAGDAYAQEIYGSMLGNGVGIEADPKAGFAWLVKGAANGRAGAIASMGVCYAYGRGVEKDGKKAVELLRESIEKGDSTSMVWLGWLYAAGNGVEMDEKVAIDWYRKGAEKGHTMAMASLAGAYSAGQGVKSDDAEAVRWYKKAADLGSIPAMHALGAAHEEGQLGLARDPNVALRWYRMAAELGDRYARDKVQALGGN
jgi:TPR repeat protein